MKEFTLKVKSLVTSKDPFNKKTKISSFYIELKDLVPGLPVDSVNTRFQNTNQSIYKKMIDGAIKNPESFHLNNSGILIFARSCELISRDKIRLKFSSFDGVGDGGHTYKSIQLANSKTGGVKGGFVRIQVISGLDQMTQRKVCLARNTSASNTESTIFNHNGDYDLLKKKLSHLPYYKDISFRQNEKKPIDIRFLVSLLSVFVLDEKLISDTYFNKSKVLKHYVSNKDLFIKKLEEADRIFKFYDLVKSELSLVHLKEKDDNLKSLFSQRKSGLFKLKFTGEEIKVNPHDRLAFASLFVVRNLIGDGSYLKKSDRDMAKSAAELIYSRLSLSR